MAHCHACHFPSSNHKLICHSSDACLITGFTRYKVSFHPRCDKAARLSFPFPIFLLPIFLISQHLCLSNNIHRGKVIFSLRLRLNPFLPTNFTVQNPQQQFNQREVIFHCSQSNLPRLHLSSSIMAKRSREDFEPSLSPEELPSSPEDSSTTSVRIVHLTSKIQQLDPEASGEANTTSTTTTTSEPAMRCSLPPHRQTLSFQTFEDYEVHYAKEHTHRCLECRKNFPTSHFLNLHIEENHDSLMIVRRERGEKTVC